MNIDKQKDMQDVLDILLENFDSVKWNELHQMAFTLYRTSNQKNKKIRKIAKYLERLNFMCLEMAKDWHLFDENGEALSVQTIYDTVNVNNKKDLKYAKSFIKIKEFIDKANNFYSFKELFLYSGFYHICEMINQKELTDKIIKKWKKQNKKIHGRLKKVMSKCLKVKEGIQNTFLAADKIKEHLAFGDALSSKQVVMIYLDEEKNNAQLLKKVYKVKKACKIGLGAIAIVVSIHCLKPIDRNPQEDISKITNTETNLDTEIAIDIIDKEEVKNNIPEEAIKDVEEQAVIEEERKYIAPGEDLEVEDGSYIFETKEDLSEQINGKQPYYASSLEIGRKAKAVVLSNEDEFVVSYDVAEIDTYIDADYDVEGYIVDNQFSFEDGEFVASEGFYLAENVNLKRELKR